MQRGLGVLWLYVHGRMAKPLAWPFRKLFVDVHSIQNDETDRARYCKPGLPSCSNSTVRSALLHRRYWLRHETHNKRHRPFKSLGLSESWPKFLGGTVCEKTYCTVQSSWEWAGGLRIVRGPIQLRARCPLQRQELLSRKLIKLCWFNATGVNSY